MLRRRRLEVKENAAILLSVQEAHFFAVTVVDRVVWGSSKLSD
jgi:hypothetical protein